MKTDTKTKPQETPLTPEGLENHFRHWAESLGPAGTTNKKQAEKAVERLYARTGMEKPSIFWCQSFYQMLTMPSLVIGILHSDLWDLIAGQSTPEASSKQWNQYWNKSWPEVWKNGGFPLLTGMNRTTRIARDYGHLEGALISQLKRELGKALHSGRLEYIQSKLNREMYRLYWARLEGTNFANLHWNHTKHDVYAELTYIRNRNFDLPAWKGLPLFDEDINTRAFGLVDLFGLLAMRLGAEPSAQERRMVHLPAHVPFLATAELLLDSFPEQCLRIEDDVRMWLDLARSCSSILCLDGLAFVCEKADSFHITERRRLHNAQGPALTYPDGFAQFAWEGTIVPQFVVEDLDSITVNHIETCDNAEVRRVMLDRYGTARYVIDAGIEPVHSDDYGTLYRKELRGDEALVMVKVVNSTAEPDGTFKDYFLRVPPNIVTARQAVAWTFGLNDDDYDPSIQT
jgi:hypothetical protein